MNASGRNHDLSEVESALRDKDFAADLLEASDSTVSALLHLCVEVSRRALRVTAR